MVTAVGSETRVNIATAGAQYTPFAAQLNDGRQVVVWVDQPAGGLMMRFLSASGVPAGAAIKVDTTSQASEYAPRVTVLKDGSFVVAWDEHAQVGDSSTIDVNVMMRRFSATGAALGAAVQVNVPTDMRSHVFEVVALANGGFGIEWIDFPDTGPSTAYFRAYNGSGQAGSVVIGNWDADVSAVKAGYELLKGALSINNYLRQDGKITFQVSEIRQEGRVFIGSYDSDLHGSGLGNFQLTVLSGQRYLATWYVDDDTVVANRAIKGQLLDAQFQKTGATFDIASGEHAGSAVSISQGEDNTFLATWHNLGLDYDIYAREFRYDAGPRNVSFETASTALREGEQRKITVRLSDVASEDITFTYAFVDGTARYGTDLKSDAKAKQVTIKAGQQSVDIALRATQDLTDEGTESLTLRLISASGATLGTTTEATVLIVDRPLKNTATLFETNGKLVMMATLAEASYVWQRAEADQPALNAQKLAAKTSVTGWLSLLTTFDLPGLSVIENVGSYWRYNGLENGVYHNENGAALIARSSDALFVAFRGTNDGADKVDWAQRHVHFNLFDDMIDELVSYIIAQRAGGAPITKIYLTGHSLGAGMVKPAWHAFEDRLKAKLGVNDIAIEGVTFANPGSAIGLDSNNPKISNFWNGADIIQIASAFSGIEGDHYKLNNLSRDILFTGVNPFDAHSSELYRAAIAFLFTEGQAHGVRLDLAALDSALRGFQIERISYGIKQTGADSFSIGQGKDFIIAGAFEIFQDAMVEFSSGVFEILYPDAAKLLKASTESANAFKAASGLMNGLNAGDAADLGSSILNLLGMIPGLKKLLAVPLTILAAGTAIIRAVEAYHESDLILGGAQNDLLFGLGGHDAIFGGEGDDELWGGTGNDLLYGGGGNDFLVADSGYDRMLGGIGNDIYVVQSASQTVEEKAGEGIDTVSAFVSYDLSGALSSHVERLILAGLGSFNAIGNERDNTLTGNDWDNRIEGRGGVDVVIGGGGADFLLGGAGNDGLLGGAGHDTLDGGSDRDRMLGGAGNDVFYADRFDDEVRENAGEGYDTVISTYSYALGKDDEIEVMRLLNPAGRDELALTGNGYGQSMTGNAGTNILDGKGGADTMVGLGGNDTYYVDTNSDVVTESAGGGVDKVFATASYTLRAGAEIEMLSAYPVAATTGMVLIGNEISQQVIGTAGGDTLYGKGGKDTLTGAGGQDTLEGGTEDDAYVIGDARTVVIERSGEGALDQVMASVSYTLGATVYVEVLRTDSDAGTAKIDLTGNDFANQLIGNEGVNVLSGGKGSDSLFGKGGNDVLKGEAGEDWLMGGAGNDTMFGGANADRFSFDSAVNAANNVDYLADFDPSEDYIYLKLDFFRGFSTKGQISADAFHAGAAAQDASDRILYDASSGALYYDADGTGALGAQQFAKINSNLALTYADIYII